MKKIIASVLIVLLLMTSPVLAESVMKTIEVMFNTVQVQINGEDLEADSILYNGTTYLPMRKVAESVGKDVDWNGDTMTANIVDKDLPGIIECGFGSNDGVESYGATFTDGFKVSMSRKKQKISTIEGVIIGTNTDGLKDKFTITKPIIIGFNSESKFEALKYDYYSSSIPEEFKIQLKELDFFENFNSSNFTGVVYFNENTDGVYYDDGVHKCKLYFERVD